MASPTPWKCSWKTQTNEYAIKSVFPSPSPCTSSIFFCLHINNRRTRITTTFCLSDPSSDTVSNSGKKLSKSLNIYTVESGKNYSDSEPEGFRKISPKIDVPSNRDDSQKIKYLSFETLFGKKFLWRRIFFASTKVRSIILLNVIAVVYASNIPVLKEVEAIVDPSTFTVVRFVLAAVPFVPFVWQSKDDIQTRNAGLELGFWVSLGYLMQALGMLTSDAGRASFISMFTVIVVPLLDGMLGAIIPTRTWVGALMSILGVGLLESSGSPPSVGDLLNILSAVFFGIHMLRTEHISRSTNKKNFLALLGYELCVVAVFSIVWYIVEGGVQEFDTSTFTWRMFFDWMVAFPWIPALYTGVFSTGLCLWVELAAMRNVSATETAIIYGLEPVWGAAFAWFLLGERWGTTGWIGAALVLGGSLTVQILGSSSPTPSRKDKDISDNDDRRIPEKQKNLSISPVAVRSKKHITDLLKK